MDLFSFHYLGGVPLNIYELDLDAEKDVLIWICNDFNDFFDFRSLYSGVYDVLNIIINIDVITITVIRK